MDEGKGKGKVKELGKWSQAKKIGRNRKKLNVEKESFKKE